MALEDPGPAGGIGHRQGDHHVEPARPLGGWVERFGIVGGGDREDVVPLADAIERRKKIGQRRVGAAGVAVAEHEVDVIEHDERRPEGVTLRIEVGDRVSHRVGVGEERRVAAGEFAGDHADEVRLADTRRPRDQHPTVGAEAKRLEQVAAARRRGEEHVDLRPEVVGQDQPASLARDRGTDADPHAAIVDAGLEHPAPERVFPGLEPGPECLEGLLGDVLGRLGGQDRELPLPVTVVDRHAERLGSERARREKRHQSPRHRDFLVGADVELRPGRRQAITGGADDHAGTIPLHLEPQQVAQDGKRRAGAGELRARQIELVHAQVPDGELRRREHRCRLVPDELA